jgi:hypothetical protein
MSSALLPAGTRKKIIHAELDKLMKDKYGENAAKLMQEHKWVYERMHEHYRSAIKEPLAAGLAGAIDDVADDLIKRASAPIDRNNIETAFSTGRKFVTWVDCLVREMFVYVAPSSTVPRGITFELIEGVDAPMASGVNVTLIWQNNDYAGRAGIIRGSNMAINHFPWIGRKALIMPEGDDQAAKDLAKGHRRLYVKAVLVHLTNAFPR